MTSYYTRAKARSEIEPEEVEQGDSALVTTTITALNTTPVGLQVESMGEFESMATEMAGPMATHSQLLPEGGHPSVGGHGIYGSADSPLVGVATPKYPSGPADPLDSAMASSAEVRTTADATQTTVAPGNEPIVSRQLPTVADMTAAAFRSPTVASSVVDTPAKGRRRSSSVTLSPPILSPAYDIEQSQSVPLRIGRAASLQRAASSQRR